MSVETEEADLDLIIAWSNTLPPLIFRDMVIGWVRDKRDALASALRSSGSGEGWVLVPREPDDRLVEIGARAIAASWFTKVKHPVDPATCSYAEEDLALARAAYRAMIAASPKPLWL